MKSSVTIGSDLIYEGDDWNDPKQANDMDHKMSCPMCVPSHAMSTHRKPMQNTD